jgi:hypothetical protein
MEAIRHGFSVYFVSLPDLLDRLVQAQAENRMRKKMAHLRKCRLLVLDEIGYRSLDKQATTCLFQLISERYERGSMSKTRTTLRDPDVQQELRRMGVDLSGQRDRQRDSRSSVAPLAHHQHQGRELPAEGQAQGRGVDAAGRRAGHRRRWRMIPAPRLRLKRPTGWFAAGQEVATALPLLSDAAFKLYVFLCLNLKTAVRRGHRRADQCFQ